MRLIGCPVTEDIRITSIHQPVDDRRIVRPCPVRRSHQLVAPIEETGRQIPKRIHHMRLQNHCAAANGPGLVQREKRMPKVVEKAEVEYQIKKTVALRSEIINRLVLTFRSEEHTSELQSLMRISYAVFC